MTENDQHARRTTQDEQHDWYSGPIDPVEVYPYFEWLLQHHDGSLVESDGEADYYVEITRLEKNTDDVYEYVEGARVDDDAE